MAEHPRFWLVRRHGSKHVSILQTNRTFSRRAPLARLFKRRDDAVKAARALLGTSPHIHLDVIMVKFEPVHVIAVPPPGNKLLGG